MKRELGIARCGLACCICSENEHCQGCNSEDCPDKEWCENRSCSIEKNIENCFYAKLTAGKVYLRKSSRMDSLCLPKGMASKTF